MSCHHTSLRDIEILLYGVIAAINSNSSSSAGLVSTVNTIDTNVDTILSLLQPHYSPLMNAEHVIPVGQVTNYTLIPVAITPILIPLNTPFPVHVFGAGGIMPQPGTFSVTRTGNNTYTVNSSNQVPLQSVLSFN
jgi:hypothetical protein